MAIAVHADLGDADFSGFVRSEEDVIVGGILSVKKFVGGEVAAKVVASSGRNVECSENFFILDISTGEGEDLGAEAELAQFARDGVGDDFVLMIADGLKVPPDERGMDDSAIPNLHESEGAILVFHGECAFGAGWNEIDFACRKISDVGLFPAAEAMTFLGFLLVEQES